MNKKMYLTIFSAFIIKFGLYGFNYYPILDDYIQYNVYRLFENPFTDVILKIGTFTTRPIANLLDVYFYAHFWGNLGIIFLLVTIMHFFSAFFLEKSLSMSKKSCGAVFYIIFGLYPLLSEATYWISASSRLVVGTFFASLSIYVLSLYFRDKKWGYIFLYTILNLVSYGFYEQVIVLSFILSIFIIFINNKKSFLYIIPIVNLIIIASWYVSFLHYGAFSTRGDLDFNLITQLNYIIRSLKDCLGYYNAILIKNSFLKGFNVINPLCFFVIISISLLFLKNKSKIQAFNKSKLLLGLLIVFMPFIPYLVLENAYISNRNMFVSFIGIALILDMVFKRIKTRNVFCVLMVFVFLICNCAEIYDYKSVFEADKKICEGVLPYIENSDTPIYLINAKQSYINQSSLYGEHIKNLTHADWAITGGIRAYSNNPYIRSIIPVPKDYQDFVKDAILLYITDDLNVIKFMH